MTYLSLSRLQREQNQLSLNLIEYSLEEEWQSSRLIGELRKCVYPKLPSGLFDPQDLEHQTLFRLTTYDPNDITDETIDEVIREQHAIIENRLSSVSDREYLFRGFNHRSKDLNTRDRLELKHDKNRLYATGFGRTIEVEFRKITDDATIRLFTEKLHYIHHARATGDTFGFYFTGDDIPWGVETIEWGLNIKKYKQDALLAHGIDPSKAVEVTRLYLLPGSPRNAISILDGLVAKYYREKGMEAMYTTTMPMYAKTKGATTSGGMRSVLLVKELSHKFTKSNLGNKTVYQHSVNANNKQIALKTSSKFPTLLTVETFLRLNKNKELVPLPALRDKTIFINTHYRRSEKVAEMRFLIENLSKLLSEMQNIEANYVQTCCLNDSFWQKNNSSNKIRLRQMIAKTQITYEVSTKYRISKEKHIRTTINDILYRGDSYDNALSAIKIKDKKYHNVKDFERIRMTYATSKVFLSIDICPFGSFLKISGDADHVLKTAKILCFKKDQSLTDSLDSLYEKWCESLKIEKQHSIKFGLGKTVRE